MELRRTLFSVLWLCTVIVFVRSSFLDTMREKCGHTVDKLFPGKEEEHHETAMCRDMKEAFKCLERETKKLDPENWNFMVNTSQVANMTVKVGKICHRESLQFCPAHVIQDKIKICYLQSGLPVSMTWDCEHMNEEIEPPTFSEDQIRHSVDCMKNSVKSCPDDELVQEYTTGFNYWEKIQKNCTVHFRKKHHKSGTAPSCTQSLLLFVVILARCIIA